MSESVFLLGLAIVGATCVLVAGAIAGAIRGRRTSRAELAPLGDQLNHLQDTLAEQAGQIAELQERLDFTERLLARGRDHGAPKPGDKDA